MSDFQTKDWDLRNVWPLPTGELAVRPALVNYTGTLSNQNLLGGFTIKNPRTGEFWHYVLSPTTLYIIEQDFSEFIQQITLPTSIPAGAKAAFTYAVVEDEIIITSPFFPTYWGKVGTGLITASSVASVNINTTALSVPRGISVGWAGRAVISDGESLYFSDALAARTYVAENIVVPPGGIIYGLHVNAGGALVLVTADGVYALPEDAAASGQIVVGIFSKLTDYSAVDYETSGVSHGRVYGLTKKGYRSIDRENSDESIISEMVLSRSKVARIHFDDYRLGRLISADSGPIVSIGGYSLVVDLATQTMSWWFSYDSVSGDTKRFDFVGKLTHYNGSPIFVASQDILFQLGNRDDLVSGTEQTIGSIAGRIPVSPDSSPVIRQIEFDTDSESTIEAFLINQTKTVNPTFTGLTVIPIIGTNSWDDGSIYREMPLRSRRTQWASRGNEMAFELNIYDYPSKIPNVVSVSFGGPGRNRPNK